jgi:hypothetical protein
MYFSVYVDYTCELIPRAFYVGKGNAARVVNTKRNLRHTNIAKKYGLHREIVMQRAKAKNTHQKNFKINS